MKVPDNWWQGCKRTSLNDGKIVSFDIDSQKWNLLLDTRHDDEESVCEYCNTESSTFEEYQLPYQPVRDGDDDIKTEDGTRYTQTATSEWTKVELEDADEGGRTIDPIEWFGEEVEVVNIADEELASLRDVKGEITYEKVFEWCLPRFGDDNSETLFEFQAARMRNYMTKQVQEDEWTPKYYHYEDVIKANHVARFYGACLDKMLMGNRSIEQIFCTREIFNAVPPIQASMTKNALEDLTACLHY
jgi:hypothetical protein